MKMKFIGTLLLVSGFLLIVTTGMLYASIENSHYNGIEKVRPPKIELVHLRPIVGTMLLVGGMVLMLRTKKI